MATGMKHASFRPYGEALSKPIGRIGLLFMLACCSAWTGCPAGPIVRALFRSVCRKESGSYNSRAPRTTPAKCGSRRRNGSSRSSTWEGTKAARTTVFSTNRPAGFDPAETAGNENGRYIVTRTLVRDGSGRTVSRRIPNFRHLGTVRFPADSAGYENPCRDRLPGRTGVLSKGCDRSRHGCEQANPITEPVPSATDHA